MTHVREEKCVLSLHHLQRTHPILTFTKRDARREFIQSLKRQLDDCILQSAQNRPSYQEKATAFNDG